MVWNHRVLESQTAAGEVLYAVHEVYYDECGRPISYTDSVKPIGEDLTTLAQELAMFRRALRRPILSKSCFPREVLPGLSRMALLCADLAVPVYRMRRLFRIHAFNWRRR